MLESNGGEFVGIERPIVLHKGQLKIPIYSGRQDTVGSRRLRTMVAQAEHMAIRTESNSSSSAIPHLSLPPYCPGNGHGTFSVCPRTLRNA
jgi:hypothetical protein